MGKTAFLFPGQGSQTVGMGRMLWEKSSAAKRIFKEADEALGVSLSQICFEGPEAELTKTVNTQPALLTMSIALLEAWKEQQCNQIPQMSFTAGHSLGEYSALVAAGALNFQDAVKLVRERGRLMDQAGQENPGGMMAILGLSREDVEKVCSETGTYIANDNCPGQIAISGSKKNLADAKKFAKGLGSKACIPLQVSGAFHSPLMQSASDGMRNILINAPLMDPIVPVVGNTNAALLWTKEEILDELLRQITSGVQWTATLRTLEAEGCAQFYEIGPGNVLTGLIGRTLSSAETKNLNEETMYRT